MGESAATLCTITISCFTTLYIIEIFVYFYVPNRDYRTLHFAQSRSAVLQSTIDQLKKGVTMDKEEAIKTAFAKADTQGAGKLTRDQLKVVLLDIIESGYDAAFIKNKEMIDDDGSLTMFIEVADLNGDKLITLDELLFIMELRGDTNDSYAWFTKLAKAADRDGNGLITVEELRYMFVKCGWAREDDGDEGTIMVFARADADGDKKLKIEELVNMFRGGPKREDRKEGMKQMFRVYDTNEDGFLSKKEIIKYIYSTGMVKKGDTPADVSVLIDKLVAGADEDMDGKLSYKEFCSMLDSH